MGKPGKSGGKGKGKGGKGRSSTVILPSIYLSDVPLELSQVHIMELCQQHEVIDCRDVKLLEPTVSSCCRSVIIRFDTLDKCDHAINKLGGLAVKTQKGEVKYIGVRLARPPKSSGGGSNRAEPYKRSESTQSWQLERSQSQQDFMQDFSGGYNNQQMQQNGGGQMQQNEQGQWQQTGNDGSGNGMQMQNNQQQMQQNNQQQMQDGGGQMQQNNNQMCQNDQQQQMQQNNNWGNQNGWTDQNGQQQCGW